MATTYLPVRELPLVSESLTGFVRRHAVAMQYRSVGQLLSLIEGVRFPAHLDHTQRGPALAALARFVRRDEHVLRQMTAHRWTSQVMLQERGTESPGHCDSKTLLRYFDAARLRVCARCLAEYPMHERLVWSFRPLGICAEHAEVLVDHCPQCKRRFSPSRLDLVRCQCGFRVTDVPSTPMKGRVIELTQRIVAWLNGDDVGQIELPAPAGFCWLDRLRSAVARAPAWLERVKRAWDTPEALKDDSLAWLAAADIVDAWPERFLEFLDVYQAIDKHRSTTTGVGRSFGHLLRDADRLEQRGYPVAAETLREYLLTRYRRGHVTAKVTLFRTPRQRRALQQRAWISQTAAAELLGVRPPTIADLVRRGILMGNITPAGKHARTVGVVDAGSVDAFRRRMAQSLTVAQAAGRLGVERHRVLDLIHAGVLRDAMRSQDGWRLSQVCVEELLATMRRLPMLSVNRSGWISLREATRQFGSSGLNLLRIVEAVRAGQLRARRDPANRSLRGMWLDMAELTIIAESLRETTESEAGYSLNRLAAVLVPGQRLKDIVLRKWIRAGLLRARRRRKAWHVPAAEVARFRATYCLAPEACALLGVRRTSLSRWEVAGRIKPVYGRRTHPGAGASVFLRADVERLSAARAA